MRGIRRWIVSLLAVGVSGCVLDPKGEIPGLNDDRSMGAAASMATGTTTSGSGTSSTGDVGFGGFGSTSGGSGSGGSPSEGGAAGTGGQVGDTGTEPDAGEIEEPDADVQDLGPE